MADRLHEKARLGRMGVVVEEVAQHDLAQRRVVHRAGRQHRHPLAAVGDLAAGLEFGSGVARHFVQHQQAGPERLTPQQRPGRAQGARNRDLPALRAQLVFQIGLAGAGGDVQERSRGLHDRTSSVSHALFACKHLDGFPCHKMLRR
jgi:hypothetical protein